jgi:hypothetical protein
MCRRAGWWAIRYGPWKSGSVQLDGANYRLSTFVLVPLFEAACSRVYDGMRWSQSQ